MDAATITTVDAVVRWIATLAGALLIPFVLIALLVYLLRAKSAPEQVRRLLRPFSSVKLLGQELNLRDLDEATKSAADAIEGYRKQTQKQYDDLAARYGIAALHQTLVDQSLGPVIGSVTKGEFRSTIHVRGTLFTATFYQLLPYYPRGGGGGRSWSIRFGIVGKAWRRGTSTVEGDLQTSSEDLIDAWGMTREEALKAKAKESRPSLLAVTFRDAQGSLVGILFADSLEKYAFGATQAAMDNLAREVESQAASGGLTAALSSLVKELPSVPIIPSQEQPGK